ncbi:MAG: sulfite exporter TauE/SafE family protein [Candidatus Promineifilaceae bacterium]
MYFPISGVTINPLLLILIGFVVGILGGFFGVGGGFLAGPILFWTGMPWNMVVGTDLAHMTGKSIVAARRHNRLGHVDVRLGLLMVTGTIIGIELGAQLIEMLKKHGNLDLIVGSCYIVILLLISALMAIESLRAIRLGGTTLHGDEDVFAFQGFSRHVQAIRLRPMISLPKSHIPSISIWVVLGVGFISGLLAGFLGVGGGFVRLPMFVYLLGVPTHVAIGTDLFEVMISAGYGTLSHALKGNVDIMIALVMQTGAAVGAQIGAVSTRYVSGPRIRLAFSLLPLLGAVLVLLRLLRG